MLVILQKAASESDVAKDTGLKLFDEIANDPYNEAILRLGNNHKLIKRELFAKQLDGKLEL